MSQCMNNSNTQSTIVYVPVMIPVQIPQNNNIDTSLITSILTGIAMQLVQQQLQQIVQSQQHVSTAASAPPQSNIAHNVGPNKYCFELSQKERDVEEEQCEKFSKEPSEPEEGAYDSSFDYLFKKAGSKQWVKRAFGDIKQWVSCSNAPYCICVATNPWETKYRVSSSSQSCSSSSSSSVDDQLVYCCCTTGSQYYLRCNYGSPNQYLNCSYGIQGHSHHWVPEPFVTCPPTRTNTTNPTPTNNLNINNIECDSLSAECSMPCVMPSMSLSLHRYLQSSLLRRFLLQSWQWCFDQQFCLFRYCFDQEKESCFILNDKQDVDVDKDDKGSDIGGGSIIIGGKGGARAKAPGAAASAKALLPSLLSGVSSSNWKCFVGGERRVRRGVETHVVVDVPPVAAQVVVSAAAQAA